MNALRRITNVEPGALGRLGFVTVSVVKHWRASKQSPQGLRRTLQSRILYTAEYVGSDMEAQLLHGSAEARAWHEGFAEGFAEAKGTEAS